MARRRMPCARWVAPVGRRSPASTTCRHLGRLSVGSGGTMNLGKFAVLTLLATCALSVSSATTASSAGAGQTPTTQPAHAPMVQDWSARYALFRHPETPEEARAGGHFQRWQRHAADPRFMLGLVRRLEAQGD